MGNAGAKPDGAPAKSSMVWLQGLACGALLAFAAPMALLLAVLMAPAIAALAAEPAANRRMTRAVTLACAAAAQGPAWHLWSTGDEMAISTGLLFDPMVLGPAWGAGASAWALCQVMPVLLHGLSDMREAARARAIRAELKSHLEAWDLEEPESSDR